MHIRFMNHTYRMKRDEDLIPLIKNKNRAAFNELFNRYSQRLYWYFFKMLNRDEETAKDFLQDLFLKIIENARHFDAGKNFSSWVYKIATNMCINEYKKKKMHTEKNDRIFTETENTIKYPHNDEKIDEEFFRKRVLKVLNTMDPETKSIFLLRFQEGMHIKEISRIILLPEGTVKSRLFYTVQRLAQRLQLYNQT